MKDIVYDLQNASEVSLYAILSCSLMDQSIGSPHLPPVGILPTLASTKSCQGGGLDPFLSAANIGRVLV